MLKKRWPGYVLKYPCAIRPGPHTKVTNYFDRTAYLMSHVTAETRDPWIQDVKHLTFLDGEELAESRQQICIQSFPRSGNSFVRRIIELITGVYTGSDMDICLASMAYAWQSAGEGILSGENLCWATKTHWPMESPLGTKPFSA